ncbi:DUF6444 domain-containing protein [Synechococcus sp. CBW1107]|uniref:DUF6444 domain-containing protein n=1 Tax=unclassified Synechococcus TaxID=2626047 RepID=UPI003A0FF0FE
MQNSLTLLGSQAGRLFGCFSSGPDFRDRRVGCAPSIRALVEHFTAYFEALSARVAQLEEKNGRGSRNSSKPPGSCEGVAPAQFWPRFYPPKTENFTVSGSSA